VAVQLFTRFPVFLVKIRNGIFFHYELLQNSMGAGQFVLFFSTDGVMISKNNWISINREYHQQIPILNGLGLILGLFKQNK
jgi:hypothetical protein